MKNILAFGDSNTYGLIPDGSGRYDFSVRYPGKLQALFGEDYHIIEEGCPGRTTVFHDPKQPYRRGIDYFPPCLLSHKPLDMVILMLGTNDCKTIFDASASEIACGLSRFIQIIRSSLVPTPEILIISPTHLGDKIGTPGYDPEFNVKSVAVSKELAAEYELLAERNSCDFLDAAQIASVSPVDEEHLDEEGHILLAKAIAKTVYKQQLIHI